MVQSESEGKPSNCEQSTEAGAEAGHRVTRRVGGGRRGTRRIGTGRCTSRVGGTTCRRPTYGVSECDCGLFLFWLAAGVEASRNLILECRVRADARHVVTKSTGRVSRLSDLI